jgi:tRNA (guanine-N7-)-methyltransferase
VNKAPSEQSRYPRKIRSYVRREGRFTPAQRSAFETLWPRYGLTVDSSSWDLSALFWRVSDVYLELGFGDGRAMKSMAMQHPENDYIGVEVHRPGVGRLMRELEEEGISNVRVVCEDGSEVLRQNIPENSLAGIMIFFPDPWHKKKHHKRRLIQSSFVHMAAQRLKPGGRLHLATDWEDYAEQMLEVLSAEALLENTDPGSSYVERPENRPLTKYEQRGVRLGHGVWDLVFRRVEAAD